MIKYQYQVIKYIHDQFTGEFGNIGIILYAPEKNYLSCRVVHRYGRLSDFFGDINGQFLLASLKGIERSIRSISEDINGFVEQKKIKPELELITSSILVKDDSALQLTNSTYGIDIDPENTLNDLFDRFIEKYNYDEHSHKHTDQYAWSKVYKKYFDKYGITRNLRKHSVTTKQDIIGFDKAWKNGVFNCYQTLAFDLKSNDAIKSKVYKWSGIIKALEEVDEKMNLYFLTTSPKEHIELKDFISETLTIKDDRLKVEIVEESKADEFAQKVRNDMKKSNLIDENNYEDDTPF